MLHSTKWRTRVLLVLAFLFGVGSVVLFALWPLGSLRIARPQWSQSITLAWDVLLSLFFFVQHSWMIRTCVRNRMTTVIPPIYQPAIYATASGVALLMVVLWSAAKWWAKVCATRSRASVSMRLAGRRSPESFMLNEP